MKLPDAIQSFFSLCSNKYRAMREWIERNWPLYDEVNKTHQPAWLYWFRHQWFVYPLFLIILPFLSIFCLQWGVFANKLEEKAEVDKFTDLFSHLYISNLVASNHLFLLNILILFGLYFSLVLILNRFWLATALYSSLIVIWMIANRLMVYLRNETITPQDIRAALSLGGNKLTSLLDKKSQALISNGIAIVIFLLLFALFLRLLFGKGRILWFKNALIQLPLRLVVICTTLLLVINFSTSFGQKNTWAYNFAIAMDDKPMMWSTLDDSQYNGAATSFLRFVHSEVMKKPQDYSSQTMKKLAERYKKLADQLNQSRNNSLTDQTVIMVLSESFSDPTRVPDLTWSEDPMPFIRNLKTQTTSGLMLSSGYGGGTANLEYQALTGLSTAIFSPSVITPYLQVVPHQHSSFSFNQMWNNADPSISLQNTDGKKSRSTPTNRGSFAIHPYTSGTYSRYSVFSEKFLFQFFYTEDGPDYVSQESRLEKSPYVSDQSSYKETLHQLSRVKDAQPVFIQLSTMQNHLPYNNWYEAIPIRVFGDMKDDNPYSIQTFARGIKYTDQATEDWLNQLNKLDRPVTVIWYGDHLPANYPDQMANPQNSLILHETDYFIWSNNAARAKGSGTSKLANANFTSPNYLLAQAAEHMSAKVSPYLAFLTQAHSLIPALEPTLQTSTDWSFNTTDQPNTYLDSAGNPITTDKMSPEQKQILKDYQLIQYDMTVGKGYLAQNGWESLPRK